MYTLTTRVIIQKALTFLANKTRRLISSKWDEWIDGMKKAKNAVKHYALVPGQYLSDALKGKTNDN